MLPFLLFSLRKGKLYFSIWCLQLQFLLFSFRLMQPQVDDGVIVTWNKGKWISGGCFLSTLHISKHHMRRSDNMLQPHCTYIFVHVHYIFLEPQCCIQLSTYFLMALTLERKTFSNLSSTALTSFCFKTFVFLSCLMFLSCWWWWES